MHIARVKDTILVDILFFGSFLIPFGESLMSTTSKFVARRMLHAGSRQTFCKVDTPYRIVGSFGAVRLFGSKRGVKGNPLGTVAYYNDQRDLKNIDKSALIETVQQISKILGYETYDVTLILVDDEEMQETNMESRGIDAPTDILSFPFHLPLEPGILEEPEFDIPDYYTLGDMVVDVPYVIRRCKEDEESDGEDDDRGVSGAMATESDPEKRIHMLLIHGMLHLVGYDHEEDDEYEEMVTREEEILKELGYQ